MGPLAALEGVLVLAALEELLDLPVEALDVDGGVGVYFPLAGEGALGGSDDDAGVGDGCDGAVAGLIVAGKELVDGFPASVGADVLVHVVSCGVEEALLDFGGHLFGVVHPVAEFDLVLAHPLGEGSEGGVDGARKCGILVLTDGSHVEEVVHGFELLEAGSAVAVLEPWAGEVVVVPGDVVVEGADVGVFHHFVPVAGFEAFFEGFAEFAVVGVDEGDELLHDGL